MRLKADRKGITKPENRNINAFLRYPVLTFFKRESGEGFGGIDEWGGDKENQETGGKKENQGL